MKVVLFCGGEGMRLRESAETVPKPMAPIGYRPILWHVMKYYAHYGHKDFILCLGYRGDIIKNYFRNYDETLTNNFVIRAGQEVKLLGSDTHDWQITMLETGARATIGQRLLAARPYIEPDEMFLANYSDGLTNAPLDEMIRTLESSDDVACFLAVRPNLSYHFVRLDETSHVCDIQNVSESDMRINGGFFVFRRQIFDYIHPGEDLVPGPFKRMLAAGKLRSYAHEGFWASMDTFKDRQVLWELYDRGDAPWQVWRNGSKA
ncbi:MAG: glucose-1-phosphate cytidylyltransferase [Luteitalea sp.]|nr:glucose-1-phosphate cytidylyltransferase [Luteitalea sp.]